jgi:NAD(P)-dependent dehydrogenase (short-subunit alcohol dehydrogenase family)
MMPDNRTSLKGKVALVTGAAKRLGRAVSLTLAGEGVDVVAHYNQSGRAASRLCEEIRETGVSAWPVRGDLAAGDKAGDVFKAAQSQAGPLDFLVNSASIFEKETLWETTEVSLERNMAIHVMAPLTLARALAKEGRPGHVINLLDTRVTAYDRQHAAYHVSKRALLTMTRMLAVELAPKIAVNAVAPGLILPPPGEDESYLDKLTHTNPLERHGDPADIADAVLFLLRSRFITGQIIYVDGGYHMKGHMYD